MLRLSAAVVLCALAPGAAHAQRAPEPVPLPPYQQQALLGGRPTVALAGAAVVTWSSPLPDAINAHVVRAPGGLVLFDALRRSDQVEDLVAVLESVGDGDGRPAAILLTHAHTDHYGGIPFVRDRYPGVPVWSSEAALVEMRDDVFPDNENRRAMFGVRFATQETLNEHLPTDLVEDGVPFEVAGLRVVPLVMGGSESPAAVVYWLPSLNVAVVGDLVNVLVISAPTVSLDARLDQLDRIEAAVPADATLHVGHGPSGPAGRLIADQRAYLVLLRDLVAEAAADDQGVSAEETARIVRQMRIAYPHHRGAAFMPPEDLIRASVGWVADQLTGG